MNRIDTVPLCFDEMGLGGTMTKALEGVDSLVCSYWIRFEEKNNTHDSAALRVKSLFECAASAGVKKITFTSHTRATKESPFSYMRGKAKAEEYLRELSELHKVNYSVVRPCGIFLFALGLLSRRASSVPLEGRPAPSFSSSLST